MPIPQPPLIIVDNVFDRINLYPTGVISYSGGVPIVGREQNYVADYRRERSYYESSVNAANQGVIADVGAGVTAAVDALWLDRGHNIWNTTVNVQVADDPTFTVVNHVFNFAVPAQGTVGGDPTTGFCVTEEGSLYTLFATTSARRYFLVRITNAWQPIFTGIILGKRTQLLEYSSVRDEDAGGRTERSQESDAAYLAVDRVYPYRTCSVALDLIGAAEYDASIRYLRATLFERNQPTVIVMNYGDKPERAWLFQYQGKAWSAPMTRVHRKWTGSFREVGALIR